ncbi:HlyU family transcriptional regulator [Gellertiella hungarica]|uniref:Transcriptional activator HlyU n=1 Tax=Gellertiella hungarica TaxID=1572859 RepID=A0A7W6J592_9HYPH|nr:HlyU family transcriptional regulator [Gellertiella hungarica]MBB4065022.1 hypothetical protein [Gellertiella hungarica]
MTGFVSKILSFLGGNASAAAPAPSSESREAYKDVTLVAQPMRDGNQFRIAGRIEKKDGERILVRQFIRADVFNGEKEAVEFTLRKARQIVDQHGNTLFADGEPDGRV